MRRFMGADDQARNSSVESEANDTRTFNEFMDIRGHLFDDMPDEVFIDAFGEDFRNPAASTPEELTCEKAFCSARHSASGRWMRCPWACAR